MWEEKLFEVLVTIFSSSVTLNVQCVAFVLPGC